MASIETDDAVIHYDDSIDTKTRVFEAVVEFFKEHGSFNGESIMQCDDPIIHAPELLADIADDIIEFDVQYKDDQE